MMDGPVQGLGAVRGEGTCGTARHASVLSDAVCVGFTRRLQSTEGRESLTIVLPGRFRALV